MVVGKLNVCSIHLKTNLGDSVCGIKAVKALGKSLGAL